MFTNFDIKRLIHVCSVAVFFGMVYYTSSQFFFTGNRLYMYTFDWTSKNILLPCAAICALTALVGCKKLPYCGMFFYLFGVILGEMFGEQSMPSPDSGVAYHYGFAWAIGVFAVGLLVGVVAEIVDKRKQLKSEPLSD